HRRLPRSKYDLLFRRFLNPDASRCPTSDVDFCFERRGEVISKCAKYGKDAVGQIVTFGTMKSRAAVKGRGARAGLHAGRDRRWPKS
ncbi:MAG: hypothetical protein IPF87_19770, partial [Gemmatimonadetes bacterium]|nr:hypothetical protein [Gemmatimonadota bacterium]